MKEIPLSVVIAEIFPSPHYQRILEAVRKMEPIVPAFDYKGATNIEEIKARLAQRTHHEAIMNVLNPKGKANV